MGMDAIRETMMNCRHCFMCRHACPTFLATKMDSHTPRGYALLLSEVDRGAISWSGSVADRFYQCSQCGLCRRDCAYGWAEDELVRAAREEIVRAGAVPARVQVVAARLGERGSAHEGAMPPMPVPAERLGRKKPDVLYIPGNTARYRHPEIIGSMRRIFEHLDADWGISTADDTGIELYELGYTGEAKEKASAFAGMLAGISPGRVVTSCPHVCRALREQFAALGVALPSAMRVQHTAEFLSEELDAGSLRLSARRVPSPAYHDPCQLGRKLGVVDQPRKVILAATGAMPLELFHGREAAECCGSGSVMSATDPSISRRVAGLRVLGAVTDEVKTLVTACPNCKEALGAAADENGHGMAVLDLCELAAAALEDGK